MPKQNQYVGSLAICREAMRLNAIGRLPYPLQPMTLRRWLTKQSGTGKQFSNVPDERDFNFPVPKAFIKTTYRAGVPFYKIHRSYLYILLAWHNARRGGELDFKMFAKKLEAFAPAGGGNGYGSAQAKVQIASAAQSQT